MKKMNSNEMCYLPLLEEKTEEIHIVMSTIKDSNGNKEIYFHTLDYGDGEGIETVKDITEDARAELERLGYIVDYEGFTLYAKDVISG